ncbi:hypothetical protein X743_32320 [Mesorhizobium sp. LNHC252B00]|nr:hypothetical protein X743_32320 [Mesorhizobium sp. LNHC252B00]
MPIPPNEGVTKSILGYRRIEIVQQREIAI